MTALTAGTSKTFTLRDTGSVTISTSGGIASVLAIPTGGTAQTTILGPTSSRLVVGPFAEGATVVITNQSATLDYDQPYGSLVTLNDAGTALVSGDGSFLYGPVTSGTWMKVPSIFRLRIAGTGTLQMDSKDSLGNITLLTFPLTSYTSETDKIEFPYAGDDAVTIRVTLTGTLTCEVI